MAKISPVQLGQIIDLSAKDVPPKEIADKVGVERQTVYVVRSQYVAKIDARRAELAARQRPMPISNPDATFDAIMDIIGPMEPDPAPEKIPEPAPEPSPDHLPKAAAATTDSCHEPSAPESPTPMLTTTQLRFVGVRHRYTITGTRIGIDGGALMLDVGEIDSFTSELREIQQTISGR